MDIGSLLRANSASESTLVMRPAGDIHRLRPAIKVQTSMQPPSDPTHDNPTPTHQSQRPADSSALPLFQPFKPPLRERKLKETAILMVVFLVVGIGSAAVTVWMFLPSMLPKLPLTFL